MLAAGIDIILVFESTAQEILNGFSAGAADANTAVSEAIASGAPSNFFCYFACDFDTPSSDYAAIDAYLNGAASVLGVSRVGLYAGIGPVSHAPVPARRARDGKRRRGQVGMWPRGSAFSNSICIAIFSAAVSTRNVGFGTNLGQWQPATPAGLSVSATGIQTTSISWSSTYVTTSYTLDRELRPAGRGRRSIPARILLSPTAACSSARSITMRSAPTTAAGTPRFRRLPRPRLRRACQQDWLRRQPAPKRSRSVGVP